MQELGRFVFMQDKEISQEKILGTVKKVLGRPIPCKGMSIDLEDTREALEVILEGLARKASTGDPAAARELREWMAVKIE